MVQSRYERVHQCMPMRTSMDAAKKKAVVITAYEELPRRRPSQSWTTGAAARAKPTQPAAVGGYSRRAMLLAYTQHLRRRGGQRSSSLTGSSGPRMLGWGEWKQKADPGAGNVVDGGENVRQAAAGRRRSWCSRLRSWVRLWIRTFFRRVRRIGENASCKRADLTA